MSDPSFSARFHINPRDKSSWSIRLLLWFYQCCLCIPRRDFHFRCRTELKMCFSTLKHHDFNLTNFRTLTDHYLIIQIFVVQTIPLLESCHVVLNISTTKITKDTITKKSSTLVWSGPVVGHSTATCSSRWMAGSPPHLAKYNRFNNTETCCLQNSNLLGFAFSIFV